MSDPQAPSDLSADKQALIALRRLRARVDQLERAASEPIAIVGMGCRFPGADGPDAFWRLLRDGVDATREVPGDRWNVDAYYDPDPEAAGKMYTRRGGFLDRVDRFDPQFFGITPREAVGLDPQQRLLLEVSWEALEHAGQAPDRLGRSATGVFVGISANDYAQLQVQAGTAPLDTYFGTGNALSVAAGRLSYTLGLQGPCMAVDTACSSSLVALHLAVQSLRTGECRMALAGGVNVILAPELTVTLCRARMLAPDGHCKTFDASADGYVRGEGCGIVVLKRLPDALADRDRILAVIRATAINQDGRSSGLTVPNGPAQQALVREALSRARVEPADIGYVESHGTGTSLGDPIEVQALGAVLGERRPPEHPVIVGAVKTNIGHLEAAAGVAGVIKTVLALQHGEIPANLHFQTPNPFISWDALPVRIPTTLTPWTPAAGRTRLAGVSSFGFSGTNAHVVLEEAPAASPSPSAPDRPVHVLTISARSADALDAVARRVEAAIADASPLADVCYTANAGRAHFTHRAAIVARSVDDARAGLRAVATGAAAPAVRGRVTTGLQPKIAFLFTGQGSQRAGMARDLYETQPTFRKALDRCAAVLDPLLPRPLVDVLFPSAGAASPIDETAFAQPALFAVEYALAELWRSWGITPSAVLGHSVGEYVAACVAGVFPLDDALRLIAARGRLMQALPRSGAMAAIAAPEADVRAAVAAVGGAVSIAALNGPDQIVVSGEAGAVDAIVAGFERAGVRAKRLPVSHAFHSALLDPMLDELARAAASVSFGRPTMAIASNLLGTLVTGEELSTPAYWRRHARESVQFARGIAALAAYGVTAFVEIGPSPTLVGLGRPLVDGDPLWLPSLGGPDGDWSTMLGSVAALYAAGASIDWAAFDSDYARRKVALPTYPFERQRFWIEATPDRAASPATSSRARTEWLYDVAWEPVPAPSNPAPASEGTWLVVGDRSGVAPALAHLLEQNGDRVVVAKSTADLDAFARSSSPKGVVYLAGIEARDAATADSDARRLCADVIGAAQALAAADRDLPGRFWIVTRGAQQVDGNVDIAPAQASLWGLGRTIAAEHAQIWGGLIDLDPQADARHAAELLTTALSRGPAGADENQIAFRDGKRLAARLVRREELPPPRPSIDWRRDGAYFVTGGFGGLGLEVARWMAREGARRLLLAGRHALPPRAQWSGVNPSGPDGARIAAVLELERLGADVEPIAIDVGDESQLRAWYEGYVRERRPAIRGVVHAAGVMQYRSIADHGDRDLDGVFQGKVRGASALDRVLGDAPLDFFVLFSSAAAILDSPLLGTYAAANAFLDALALDRRRRGRTALSVNWGSWSRVGMAAANEAKQGSGEFIAPEDGIATLAALIRMDLARATVLPIEWDSWRRRHEAFSSAPLLRHLVTGEQAASAGAERADIRAALQSSGAAERRRLIESSVTAAVAAIVRLPSGSLDAGMPLRHIGLDSLMALELRNRIRSDIGVSVPLTTVVEGPSIIELATVVLERFETEPSPAPVAVTSESLAPGGEADSLLSQVDTLSDESVDELLRRMLAEKGS